MSLHEIPAEIFRDLLLNVEGEISAASPFAFLLTEQVEAELEPHVNWLKRHKLLQSPARQNGRLRLQDPLRRSLDILARPVRRILISEIDADGPRRSVHVSDGAEVVVAMFNESDCIVSDPLDLKTFRDGVLKELGPPSKSKKAPDPLRLHPVGFAFLGGLVGAWTYPPNPGEKPPPEPFPELEWPLERSLAEQRLGALLDDPQAGVDALDGLVGAHILQEKKGQLSVHPSFKPWHESLTSSTFMEIQRLEYPKSSLAEIQPLVRAYFAGPKGARCLIWPVDGELGDVVLSRPTAEELQSVTNYLVGYVDLQDVEA